MTRSGSAPIDEYRLLGPAFLPMLRFAVRRRFRMLKRILEQASRSQGGPGT